MTQPTIGRIVLYQEEENRDPLPAIIYGVRERNHVDLTILVFGKSSAKMIPFSDEIKVGCWSWPPRVAEETPKIEVFTPA